MRALVIGCGSIGARRARILDSLGINLVLQDADWTKAIALSQSIVDRMTQPRKLECPELLSFPLDHERADLALICTPPSTHLAIAQQCADAGLHLFIEKPLADKLDTDAITKLYHTMQERGCIGIMGQSWRFLPSLREFSKSFDHSDLISGAIIGSQFISEWSHIPLIESPYLRAGITFTSLAHSLDMVNWLFGEIDAVAALIAKGGVGSISVISDTATLLLRMKNGAQVTVNNDFYSHPRKEWVRAVTTTGAHEWTGMPNEYDTMYIEEMRHLIKAIESKQQPQPDLLQGIKILEWIDAAQRASDTGAWQRIGGLWAQLASRT